VLFFIDDKNARRPARSRDRALLPVRGDYLEVLRGRLFIFQAQNQSFQPPSKRLREIRLSYPKPSMGITGNGPVISDETPPLLPPSTRAGSVKIRNTTSTATGRRLVFRRESISSLLIGKRAPVQTTNREIKIIYTKLTIEVTVSLLDAGLTLFEQTSTRANYCCAGDAWLYTRYCLLRCQQQCTGCSCQIIFLFTLQNPGRRNTDPDLELIQSCRPLHACDSVRSMNGANDSARLILFLLLSAAGRSPALLGDLSSAANRQRPGGNIPGDAGTGPDIRTIFDG
jgi:hypothetical protein